MTLTVTTAGAVSQSADDDDQDGVDTSTHMNARERDAMAITRVLRAQLLERNAKFAEVQNLYDQLQKSVLVLQARLEEEQLRCR